MPDLLEVSRNCSVLSMDGDQLIPSGTQFYEGQDIEFILKGRQFKEKPFPAHVVRRMLDTKHLRVVARNVIVDPDAPEIIPGLDNVTPLESAPKTSIDETGERVPPHVSPVSIEAGQDRSGFEIPKGPINPEDLPAQLNAWKGVDPMALKGKGVDTLNAMIVERTQGRQKPFISQASALDFINEQVKKHG